MASLLSIASIFTLLVNLTVIQHTVGQTFLERSGIDLLENLIPKNYSKTLRPHYGGIPIEVGVTMFIIDVSEISEKTMDFKLQLYFRQGWRDERLAFSPQRFGVSTLYVGDEVASKLWLPDTFIANAKRVKFLPAISSGNANTFLRLKSNGDILYSKMLEVTASCPMNLRNYPFDRQFCQLEMESYGSSMADITYRWGIEGKGGVGIANSVALPTFKVLGINHKTKTEQLSSGNYSRMIAQIELSRASGIYLNRVYLPAFFIVLISWVPLWLVAHTKQQHYTRVALLLVIFLSMIHFNQATNSDSPTISYHRSLDCYLLAGVLAIGLSLVEATVVAVLSSSDSSKYESFKCSEEGTTKGPNVVDKWARLAIPALWLLYNVLYGACVAIHY